MLPESQLVPAPERILNREVSILIREQGAFAERNSPLYLRVFRNGSSHGRGPEKSTNSKKRKTFSKFAEEESLPPLSIGGCKESRRFGRENYLECA